MLSDPQTRPKFYAMKKLINKGYLFKLIDFSQPIIKDRTKLLSDNNKGGTLLTYSRTEIRYISLWKHEYVLHPVHKFTKILVFFNPLKKDWNRQAYWMEKIYWGKKHHLLTKLWLEVDIEFKDIFSVTLVELRIIPQCKDKNLIKRLNARNETFILQSKQ